MTPVHLRCDYRENPLGLDLANPGLSWQLESARNGARQTAYQIMAAASLTALAQDDGELWDSGRINSNRTTHVHYEGVPLAPLARAWWKVRAWDENGGRSEWSRPAFWEAGLLAESDWTGKWIQDMLLGGPRTSAPGPFMRAELHLRGTVVRARLVATALGLYEFRINGEKVGDDLLTPGWTDYRKRVQYQIYDVTTMVKEGQNVLGAILGDGWYCGNLEWQGRQFYGDRPALRGQLHVWYSDGSSDVFSTDAGWRTAFGPILESDLLMGESYDARRELTGWDRVGYDDSSWRTVEIADVNANCVSMRGPTVKALQELVPVADPSEYPKFPFSDYVFDLGQNMVGKVRLKVRGKRGTTIRLKFGEMLKEDGRVYTENLRLAKQTDYYTLKGDPHGEVWESRFTFHGFRYVEAMGFDERPTRDSITGIVMHSDTPVTGTFECSDELVNQLQRNIDWGQRGNFVDIPTDCPQRDERLGWTGDAQVFIRTACFNRDVAGFFTKWQDDLRDSQGGHGEIPPVAPNTNAVGADGGPAWADALLICPWTIYLCYGDRNLLADHFASLQSLVEFLRRDAKGLIRSHPDKIGFKGFGDWLSTNAATPLDLIGTAFFAYSSRLLAKIAAVLGHNEDAAVYGALADRIKEAFQKRFVSKDGVVLSNTQTANVLALHFDLVPAAARSRVVQALVDDINQRGGHLSTGFVGTPYISRVLSDNGRLDVAYALLTQKTWPAWLYPVTKGATTIWERWDGWTDEKGFQDAGMNSFNHYAYGAVGAWLYAVVAGIDVDESRPGYEHIILRPRPGGEFTYAKAGYDSIHGRIESSWTLSDEAFVWHIRIPANTTATAYVPFSRAKISVTAGARYVKHTVDSAIYELPSGSYRFVAAR